MARKGRTGRVGSSAGCGLALAALSALGVGTASAGPDERTWTPPYSDASSWTHDTWGVTEARAAANPRSGGVYAYADGWIGGSTSEAQEIVWVNTPQASDVSVTAKMSLAAGAVSFGLGSFSALDLTWSVNDGESHKQPVALWYEAEALVDKALEFSLLCLGGAAGVAELHKIEAVAHAIEIVNTAHEFSVALDKMEASGVARPFTLSFSFRSKAGWNKVAVGARATAAAVVTGSAVAMTFGQVKEIRMTGVPPPPVPADLDIEEATVKRRPDSLTDAVVHAVVRNVGEEAGQGHLVVTRGASAPGEPVADVDLQWVYSGQPRTIEVPVTIPLRGTGLGATTSDAFLLRTIDAGFAVDDQAVAWIQRLSATIEGRVTDTTGRAVAGATVSAAGLSTTTSEGGFYHLRPLGRLGPVEVTATHPAYTASGIGTATLAWSEADALAHPSGPVANLDLVLGQVAGTLSISARDRLTGERIAGVSWTANSPPTVLSGTIAVATPDTVVSGVAPGRWWLLGRKGGYGAATAVVEVLPGGTATVVLEMAPFSPRDDDGDLTVTGVEAMWKRTIEGNVLAHASSKDGALLALVTARPGKGGVGRLYLIDAATGADRHRIDVMQPTSEKHVSLDVWHDGDAIAVAITQGGMNLTSPGQFRVYDGGGTLLAEAPYPKGSVPFVSVSPDGAFVHFLGLSDRLLRPIPDERGRIGLRERGRQFQGPVILFTPDDGVVARCDRRQFPAKGGSCRVTLGGEVTRTYADVAQPVRFLDRGGPLPGSGTGDETIFFVSGPSVRLVRGDALLWEKRAEDVSPSAPSAGWQDASLSPGGRIAMIVDGAGNARMRVFDDSGRDVTPSVAGADGIHDVVHVTANERGLFYLTARASTIEYVRIGRYPNVPPRAAFSTTPTPAAAQATVRFDGSASSDPDGHVTAWAWTFGDGATATGITATHVYADFGSYPAALTVTDDRGGRATTTHTIAVGPPNAPPSSSFAWTPASPAPSASVAFDGRAASDSDGTIVSYRWAFGDGATTDGPTASHAYAAEGIHEVTLTVTDDDGATSTARHSVQVRLANQAPTASFTVAPTDPAVGATVTFDASASADADGQLASWSWAFGDGASSGGRVATHVFASPGTFTVALTVTDGGGATASARSPVTVRAGNAPPAAVFTVSPPSLRAGDMATFDGSASTDVDGSVVSWSWSFGDGASSTGATATHAYAAAGAYPVALTVADDGGASGTTTRSVIVRAANRPPVASFTHSPLAPRKGETVTLDASTSVDLDGDALTCAWTFGDGTSASGVTASHSFATAGTYVVTLTVTDPDGATDTRSTSVVVTR